MPGMILPDTERELDLINPDRILTAWQHDIMAT